MLGQGKVGTRGHLETPPKALSHHRHPHPRAPLQAPCSPCAPSTSPGEGRHMAGEGSVTVSRCHTALFLWHWVAVEKVPHVLK